MHVSWRAAMVALVLLLSACGEGTPVSEQSDAPVPASTAPPTNQPPTATPTATPSVTAQPNDPNDPNDPADLAELARLAESAQAALTQPPATDPAGLIEGADVSWPQCPTGMGIPERPTQGSPMPLDSARFVVLGLTNGPGFTRNPCLVDQVAWARERHLLVSAYSVISWPSATQLARSGSPAQAGYDQAIANIATLRAAGLTTPAIWLDVEPVPDFDWPTGAAALRRNAAVVQAAARAYADQGFRVGVYSTTALWRRVVGEMTLGLPEWRAAGHTSRAEAVRRCGQERVIQGGSAVITQWVEHGRDRNVTCPGQASALPLWFHQY